MLNCKFRKKKKIEPPKPKGPKLELHAPKKAYYTINQSSTNRCSFNKIFGNRFTTVDFITEYFEDPIEYPWITTTCYQYQKSLPDSKYEGNKLIILHITTLMQNKLPFTFLLSHGMSSTLGTIYPFLIDFATQMKCNIIAYDYSGFGHSEGNPSEEQLNSDIEEVGSFARNTLRVSTELLILFAMSIGSIPTINLAIHKDYINSIGGMLLLSPLSKGFFQVIKKDNDDTIENDDTKPDKEEDNTIRIEMENVHEINSNIIIDNDGMPNIENNENVKGNYNYDDEDTYETYAKVRNVQCSVFIIHGKKDKSISYLQSKGLAERLDSTMQWFPSKGDHYNIITEFRYKFYIKLRFFIEELIEVFNTNIMRVSYQFDMLPITRQGSKKKVIYIEDDYVEYADELNDGLIDYDFQYQNIERHKEVLFEILPKDHQPNSYGSDGRTSRILRHVGTCRLRDEDDGSLFLDDDNYSDIEISKKSSIDNHNTNSNVNGMGIKSPSIMKSPYISPTVKKINSGKINQRCNTLSPLLYKSLRSKKKKKLELIDEASMIPLGIMKKKSASPIINLKSTSAFPDLK